MGRIQLTTLHACLRSDDVRTPPVDGGRSHPAICFKSGTLETNFLELRNVVGMSLRGE